MTVALVLLPAPNPDANPAARATTFFRAPQSSTPARSNAGAILKALGSCNSAVQIGTSGADRASKPKVDSVSCPLAISDAILAPESTETEAGAASGRDKDSRICSDGSSIPSGSPEEDPKSPLINEIELGGALEDFSRAPRIVWQAGPRNSWGSTKTRRFAPSTARPRSDSARTLSGSVIPGRYFGFVCVWKSQTYDKVNRVTRAARYPFELTSLMSSLSFLALTTSS
jgi:hypothetical protein